MATPEQKEIARVRAMVEDWLADAEETCLDRLVQMHGEAVTRLERDDAPESQALYERLEAAIKKEAASYSCYAGKHRFVKGVCPECLTQEPKP